MKQLRERLSYSGIQTLSIDELLTVILCTGTTSHSENLRAHLSQLLREEGGLRKLIQAEFGELCQDYGFGEVKSAQLQAVFELARRLCSQKPEEKHQILCAADAAHVVMAEMTYLDHEQMRVLVLDTRNHVIANQCLYQGTLNSATVRIAEIFRPALTRKGASIILCHNHPSGSIEASLEDREITRQCREAGQLLEIELLDHLIIGDHRYLSLKELMQW